jgi:hypothetical protein
MPLIGTLLNFSTFCHDKNVLIIFSKAIDCFHFIFVNIFDMFAMSIAQVNWAKA